MALSLVIDRRNVSQLQIGLGIGAHRNGRVVHWLVSCQTSSGKHTCVSKCNGCAKNKEPEAKGPEKANRNDSRV